MVNSLTLFDFAELSVYDSEQQRKWQHRANRRTTFDGTIELYQYNACSNNWCNSIGTETFSKAKESIFSHKAHKERLFSAQENKLERFRVRHSRYLASISSLNALFPLSHSGFQ
mmetsp:Transcript_24088/g.37148  ORF Transcript_24088/g.37148 Transcript_24088/m.37148 type:complete len:114 (+) Transcript_24088:766-1107(+)